MNNTDYLGNRILKLQNDLLYHEKLTNDLRIKCNKLEEKVEAQRRELKRLNNVHDLAKQFANDVLAEIYINKDNYIEDLHLKLDAFRRKEIYYEEKINNLLLEINELRGNKDE